MTILVTGSNGAIGSQVVAQLAARGARVRALSRSPDKATPVDGVETVRGDLTDVDSMRVALRDVRTLFLLNAVSPDELTQALLALNLALEAGIERVVYLSVIHSDRYIDVPHFTAKYTVERMIEQLDVPATILRPAYYMQNDVSLKEALIEHGTYPMPIGHAGVSMVDTRDLAEVAALHLIRREDAPTRLPRETLDTVGPDVLTGTSIASLWTDALKRPVAYGGDDVAAYEQRMRAFAPGWMAYDMRLMLNRVQHEGMRADVGDTDRLAGLLGRPLRSYRAFAAETAAAWASRAPA